MLIFSSYHISSLVAANFLPNKLNFCCRYYLREETIQGQKLYEEILIMYFSPQRDDITICFTCLHMIFRCLELRLFTFGSFWKLLEAYEKWRENMNLNLSYMFSFSKTPVKFEGFMKCFLLKKSLNLRFKLKFELYAFIFKNSR